MLNTGNYKRFLDDRLLIFCLGCSLLIVGESFVKAERFPYTKLFTKVGIRIGKWIDSVQIPEKSEDKLIMANPGSYNNAVSGGIDPP